jgi:hypothetical protein
MSHLIYGSCNEHLQNALALYGLAAFVVRLIEEYTFDPNLLNPSGTANLLSREQFWLNWLFSLPAAFRYNFNRIAHLPPSFAGKTHTPEVRAKISGSNHGRAVGVIITDLQGTKAEFPTCKEAAQWLGIKHQSVSCAIKRQSVVKGLYRVSTA